MKPDIENDCFGHYPDNECDQATCKDLCQDIEECKRASKTTDSIETQLRAHLQRKLKLVHGNGQITVRRLVKCLYPKNGTGYRYTDEPSLKGRHQAYRIAAQICEEAGGIVDSIGYVRSHNGKSVASRVYQF